MINKKLFVMSLFDGISCGQVALKKAGIPVKAYYASEIEKNAIKITQTNFPNTIQLGDVRQIDFSEYVSKIDLLMGGSPCQDLSILGLRKGLEGKQSSLFYKFVEALKIIKPRYFVFENVANMPFQAKNIITELLEVEPILINSSLFVQQNRPRLYWTNINIELPIQRVYKNILETNREEITLVPYVTKKIPLLKQKYGYIPEKFNPYNLSEIKDVYPCLTSQGNSQTKSSSVIIFQNGKYSKLSPEEWEKLQTLPINYTNCVNNAQRYKCIGNAWTVDVIAHILKGINLY